MMGCVAHLLINESCVSLLGTECCNMKSPVQVIGRNKSQWIYYLRGAKQAE
jgi:hypothetical protein